MANGEGGWGFTAGFVAGGLVGAALALIFAPQPGRRTRAELAELGRGPGLTQRAEAIRARAEQMTDQLVERWRLATNEAKDAARRTREQYQAALATAQREGEAPPAPIIPAP